MLEISSCETRGDDGGSHVGTSRPEKTPDSSDAMVVFQFQQLQEKKPNNRLDSTALVPGQLLNKCIEFSVTYVVFKSACLTKMF